MLKKGEVKYGDIIWTRFDPSVGHEYQAMRPAIVIQTNEQLARSNLVTVMPLTTKATKLIGNDIVIEPDARNNLRGQFGNQSIWHFFVGLCPPN